jgi:hypothetical protein
MRWEIRDKEGRMLWAGTDATLNLSLFDEAEAKPTGKARKPKAQTKAKKNAVADAQRTGGK